MVQHRKVKYVHVGQYAVAVEVTLLEDNSSWSPYMSLQDAYKLDDVREALQRGDLMAAGKHGRVYELQPVTLTAL